MAQTFFKNNIHTVTVMRYEDKQGVNRKLLSRAFERATAGFPILKIRKVMVKKPFSLFPREKKVDLLAVRTISTSLYVGVLN